MGFRILILTQVPGYQLFNEFYRRGTKFTQRFAEFLFFFSAPTSANTLRLGGKK